MCIFLFDRSINSADIVQIYPHFTQPSRVMNVSRRSSQLTKPARLLIFQFKKKKGNVFRVEKVAKAWARGERKTTERALSLSFSLCLWRAPVTREKSRGRRAFFFYNDVIIIIAATFVPRGVPPGKNKLVTIIIALRDHRESQASVSGAQHVQLRTYILAIYIRDSSSGV